MTAVWGFQEWMLQGQHLICQPVARPVEDVCSDVILEVSFSQQTGFI